MSPNIRHISKEELESFLKQLGQPTYRVAQILDWLWKNHVTCIDEMNNLSKELRLKLKENFSFTPLTIHQKKVAHDKTVKLVFKTYDGFFIEGVLIPTEKRKTACVSSQVGCSLDCAFCATGKMERSRNLNFDEIVDQFFLLEKICLEEYQSPLTNVVFMGMGEPLLNYAQVLKSIDFISKPEWRNFSPYRITVSTAGIAKAIKKLGEDKVRFELAVSLHASNDSKRSKIMSINNSNSIQNILDALQSFYQDSRNKITLEYILLKDFNDSEEDAFELIKLYRKAPIKLLNIIEYNSIDEGIFEGSDKNRLESFLTILTNGGVNAKVRRSRGKDIDAACGQLATKQ